ncbi:MCP four helix bundle domain-containing protein [Siphonobacter sp. BAB-5405]|uniref:MCP four helix bundle domain-containing protein n=1 Tax=Siphonobacter sp. BAB-5405 TaxID=1864825 RepID=UPI001E5CE252|nr:MCP four helix bundle domain-containing protein [Siphonobacter sp. BAB-5405]
MEKPRNNPILRNSLLIASLLGLILTSIFLSRRSVNQIQQASVSIYKDRLVPTAIIAKLTSQVYSKRLLLESYMLGKTKPEPNAVTYALDRSNRQIDSLMTEFVATNLTHKEAEQFDLLKQRLEVYNQLEGDLTRNLTDSPQAQQILFVGRGNTAFSQVIQTLTDLSALQVKVGQELLNQSNGQSNYIYVLTALQIGWCC